MITQNNDFRLNCSIPKSFNPFAIFFKSGFSNSWSKKKIYRIWNLGRRFCLASLKCVQNYKKETNLIMNLVIKWLWKKLDKILIIFIEIFYQKIIVSVLSQLDNCTIWNKVQLFFKKYLRFYSMFQINFTCFINDKRM